MIHIESIGSLTSGTSNTLQVPAPATISPESVLFLFCYGGWSDISAPAGWGFHFGAGLSSVYRQAIFSRVLTGSQFFTGPLSVTRSGGSGQIWRAVMLSVRYIDSSSKIDDDSGTVNTGRTATCPSIETEYDYSLLIASISATGNSDPTDSVGVVPSGYTTVLSDRSNQNIFHFASKPTTAAGVIPAASFTGVGADDYTPVWSSLHFAFKQSPNVKVISGDLSAEGSLSGSLTLLDPISASISAEGSLTGTLTAQVPLSASLAAEGTLSGEITSLVPLGAAVGAAGALSGSLTVLVPMAASIEAAGSLTGNLTAEVPMAASIEAAGSLTGDLASQVPLTAGIEAEGSLSGSLILDGGFSANISASGSLTGNLTAQVPLSASITASSATSGEITSGVPLSAAIEAAGALSGSMTSRVPLTADIEATADAFGVLTARVPLAAEIEATSDLNGILSPDEYLQVPLSASISASITVSAHLVFKWEGLTVGESFRQLLINSPHVLAVLPNAADAGVVQQNKIDQGAPKTRIWFVRSGHYEELDLSGVGGLEEVTFDVECMSDDIEKAIDLAIAVKRTLTGYRGVMGSYFVQAVEIEDQQDDYLPSGQFDDEGLHTSALNCRVICNLLA